MDELIERLKARTKTGVTYGARGARSVWTLNNPDGPEAVTALTTMQDREATLIREREWQPIETAPKDEKTYILAMRAGAAVPFVASYDADFDNWYTFNGALENCGQKFEPTHWMPVPKVEALGTSGLVEP